MNLRNLTSRDILRQKGVFSLDPASNLEARTVRQQELKGRSAEQSK